MSFFHITAGFVMGTFFGVGIALFYIRHKLKSQLGMMQNQMEDMFDATAEMNDAFGGIDDLEQENIEEADFEEKEEKEDS